MTANITSFFVALYFFYRHNKYCEPGSKYDPFLAISLMKVYTKNKTKLIFVD